MKSWWRHDCAKLVRSGTRFGYGGGTGIGLAIVTSLLDRGVDVVAIGRRREALEEAKSLGADVLSWDVTHNPYKLFETIGRVDGLVHNAGLCIRAGITEWSSDDWESMWRVNLLAPALLSQAFADQVDGPGAIVAVASTLAQRPSNGTAGYGSTKAGLVNLIKHLALELAPRGIRANVVLPGIVPTDMTTGRVSDGLRPSSHRTSWRAQENTNGLEALSSDGCPVPAGYRWGTVGGIAVLSCVRSWKIIILLPDQIRQNMRTLDKLDDRSSDFH